MAKIQLVVEIEERLYKNIIDNDKDDEEFEAMDDAFNNAKPLPKDATNGDVIKAMFPDVEIEENPSHKKCGSFYLTFKGNTCTMVTDYNWWNAPYKRGEEDETDN